MGFDHSLPLLAGQLAWSLPTMITAIVIGGLAIARRDGGLWWKLVVAGAAALVLGQVLSTVGTFVVVTMHAWGAQWLVTLLTVILNVAALALLGTGAITGRRGQVATR